jgi:rhomboid family GlyGly-CTERM serine protease
MDLSGPRNRFTGLLASVNGDGRRGLGLLALLGTLLALAATGEWGRARLRYERAPIASGEWWRLATAHLVHLDLRHALLNCAGAALMWALFARDFAARAWLLVLLASAAAIDAGLWWWRPQIEWYVGASGVLHGVMAAGAIAHLRRRERDGALLLAFLVGKLAWEQWRGALPLSGAGVPVVIDAHLYGALAGALCALLLRPRPEPL